MSLAPNLESVKSAPRFNAPTLSAAELLRQINDLRDQLVGEEQAYEQGVQDERKRILKGFDAWVTTVKVGL